MQPPFSKTSLFSYLALAAIILAIHCWLRSLPNRQDFPDTIAQVRFIPATFDTAGFAPLRLAGAWRVEVGDPRFGGVSAMAVDRGELLALTDSGTLIRFPRPGQRGLAMVRDLPAGPGTGKFKWDRDSEALARDPAGRGWWVAFEQWDQLWLYDPGLRSALGRVDLGRNRWRANRGVEAMVADPHGFKLFPEGGNEWIEVRAGRARSHRLVSRYGFVADAVRLPDGRLLLVARKIGLAGLAKRLVIVDERGTEPALRSAARLSLGAMDNVEAIAVEPRTGGGTRLWLMTDNDFRPRAPTLLVALDLP